MFNTAPDAPLLDTSIGLLGRMGLHRFDRRSRCVFSLSCGLALISEKRTGENSSDDTGIIGSS